MLCFFLPMYGIAKRCLLSLARYEKISPTLLIGFGGPEVSWSAENFFADCPSADLIIAGEGEETFVDFLDAWADSRPVSKIRGIYSRADGFFIWR